VCRDLGLMTTTIDKLIRTLFGDSRLLALEHRLFNTITLLNAVANIAGVFGLHKTDDHRFVLILQLTAGFLFLSFYYLSRFRHYYRELYWPFSITILVFLFANALGNAGSEGGAHYYFIPALSIAIILSNRASSTVVAICLYVSASASLFIVEWFRPDWVTRFASPADRLVDASTNFAFVQIFTGILIMVLAKNLNQERNKSDRLLLNILPDKVAQELKRTDRVRPLYYDSATVLFTDMVGFTRIAESMLPEELIEELDSCFSYFDSIIRKHKLEKIKTIGDSYMAAGGLPESSRTHAVDCVLAALEIQDYMVKMMETRQASNRPCWQLRIGIHTGPVVAGVIGREKFAYDIWGDTVNIASRFESSGSAGRINISSTTYELVKDMFICEPRGRISAKGKGEMEMYFVNAPLRDDPDRGVSTRIEATM